MPMLLRVGIVIATVGILGIALETLRAMSRICDRILCVVGRSQVIEPRTGANDFMERRTHRIMPSHPSSTGGQEHE